MESLNSVNEQSITPIERFVWDLTYACPLRCVHCYSESGRRPARMLDREDMLRIVDIIISAKPKRISLSGGEPLLAPWWAEAACRLSEAGIPVTLFTSGWSMDEDTIRDLAASVASICLSVDGPDGAIHDTIRGRQGSFSHAMATLGQLDLFKRECAARGETCYTLGIDYTVTRSNQEHTECFVEEMTSRFPGLDFIRFGAVVPEGLAQEELFVTRELLTEDELIALGDSEPRLIARAKNNAQISVTDARFFLLSSPLSMAGETIAHIEPDGELRAFTTYEAKVGNVLHEPLDVLWRRALAWRNDPFVISQIDSIRSFEDWARVTRVLDRRYGSVADKSRLARRMGVQGASTPTVISPESLLATKFPGER